jgi:hypothetical protein
MLATILFSLLSTQLLSKSFLIKIHKTTILPDVLYGCETWSLTPREEQRLGCLRRIFGPKRDEVVGAKEECIMRSFLHTLHQILLQ